MENQSFLSESLRINLLKKGSNPIGVHCAMKRTIAPRKPQIGGGADKGGPGHPRNYCHSLEITPAEPVEVHTFCCVIPSCQNWRLNAINGTAGWAVGQAGKSAASRHPPLTSDKGSELPTSPSGMENRGDRFIDSLLSVDVKL